MRRRPILRFAAAGRDSCGRAAGPIPGPIAADWPPGSARSRAWPLPGPASLARAILERVRRAVRQARYRPERHYMRGGRGAGAAAR
ncbi:hypothetical protein GCM10010964_06960 [Caldovatus sediminis]|uniref:Uncharacterized protein n=1 Tax=Caldovatus sediminis TaxID=2041189 RepID=A0A8J3EA29_9PROT|nr:hypothetical protein GCM10010964_06960 [Caldovatus sediminis]